MRTAMAQPAEDRTILLVDDDVDVCEAYAEVLSEFGYHVISMHDGREALEYLRSAPTAPNLILLDLMMPIMDGRQFLAALAAEPRLRTSPVVVMTADRHKAAVEADGYLLKPAALETLLDTVERFCKRGGAAA
jgi:CheY-like chemotaxis protein